MTCQDVRDLLEAHVDGGLDPAIGGEVDRHVATCSACAARLEHMRVLLAEAGRLPRSVTPPRDLWPGIAGRLRPRAVPTVTARQPAPNYRLPAWLLAAAAVTLITVSSGVTALLLRRGGPVSQTTQLATLPAGLLDLERDYVGASAEIERVLAEQREAMPPEAVAALERSRRVIDDAIREARAALALYPENPDLSRLLWATYQQKLDLLRRATRLTGEL